MKGALSGLVGAVSAEVFAEAIKDYEFSDIHNFEEHFDSKIDEIANKSRTYGIFLGALTTLFTGLDVDIGAFMA